MLPGARPWNLSDESTLMCCRMTAGSTFGMDDSGTAGGGSAVAEEAGVEAAAADGVALCEGASLRLHAVHRAIAASVMTIQRDGRAVNIRDNSIGAWGAGAATAAISTRPRCAGARDV